MKKFRRVRIASCNSTVIEDVSIGVTSVTVPALPLPESAWLIQSTRTDEGSAASATSGVTRFRPGEDSRSPDDPFVVSTRVISSSPPATVLNLDAFSCPSCDTTSRAPFAGGLGAVVSDRTATCVGASVTA